MAKYRQNRVNGEISRELSEIIREVKDPRISNVFISFTRVDCTPDLRYCKIFYSVMGEYDAIDVAKGLKSAGGYIRSQLAKRLNMRLTPELHFIADTSIEHGAHINGLMSRVIDELAEADRRDAMMSETESEDEREHRSQSPSSDDGKNLV